MFNSLHLQVNLSKLAFLVSLLFFVSALAAQPISIAEARTLSEGTIVQLEGTISNAPNERSLRFIQDSSAGLAIYVPDPTFNQNVRLGDRIRLEGRLVEFQGLIEIGEVLDFQLLGSPGLPEIENFDFDNAQEGKLTRLNCVYWDTIDQAKWLSGYYRRFLNGQDILFWIPETATFLSQRVSSSLHEFIGVPFYDNDGLSFLVQDLSGETDNRCLLWVDMPNLQNAGSDFIVSQFTVSSAFEGYITIQSSNSAILDTTFIEGAGQQSVLIDNLEDAELYHLDYVLFNSSDTLKYTNHWVVTQSVSSKNIEVYFNNSIRDSIQIQWPYHVEGSELVNEISERIDRAIDEVNLCAYNFNNLTIRSALDRAHQRGVQVRCIVDGNNRNLGFSNTDFPVFRLRNNALMHHKFIVVDPESAQNSWLFMGGTNLTRNQLYVDPNSALTFEDQMLAKVYQKEFETLWGGQGAMFAPDLSLRSRGKTNNTPEDMFLRSIPVRSYFSPSDGTTDGILKALESAKDEIYFSLLTFTKNEIRDLLIQKHQEGVKIKGIINNINDNGGEYYNLIEEGIDVQASNQSFIHHHKYAIIDPGTDNAALIIGSHNWTQKAEDTNDENTLILFERDLSLIFVEEFMARWCENDPLNVECLSNDEPVVVQKTGLSVFPQPTFSHNIQIHWEGDQSVNYDFFISSPDGRVLSLSNRLLVPGINTLSISESLSAGMYYLHYRNSFSSGTLRIIIVES